MRKAIADIAAERRRQIEAEGFNDERDDRYQDGELAAAAATYAYHNTYHGYGAIELWPRAWNPDWFKPTNERRDLVKAAALIVAEIERLDRRKQKDSA